MPDRATEQCPIPAATALVSVIIPTFNRCDLVQEAVQSIRDQTWPRVEIIVVDDGSTDNTVDALRAMTDHRHALHVVSQPNAGPARARNHGLTLAQGDYIFFLDSDDVMDPNALADLVRAISQSGARLALAPIRSVTLDGTPVDDGGTGVPLFSKVPLKARWFTHSALYARSLIDQAGGYCEAFRSGEDREYCQRIVALTDTPAQLDHPVGSRRHHDQGHLSVGRYDTNRPHAYMETLWSHESWRMQNGLPEITYTNRNYAAFLSIGTRHAAHGDFRDKDHMVRFTRRKLSAFHPVRVIFRLHFASNAVAYYRLCTALIDAKGRLRRRAGAVFKPRR